MDGPGGDGPWVCMDRGCRARPTGLQSLPRGCRETDRRLIVRMRTPLLSAVVLLAIVAPGSAGSRTSTVEYTPPAQPGDIYTVIDFARSGGTAEATTIAEAMGNRHR